MTCYKIKDTVTGLYSCGGVSPRWKKRGKTWTTKGALSNHFAQFKGRYGYKNPYKDKSVVVEVFEMTGGASTEMPLPAI